MQLIKKNQQGYGYKYTDLAEITKMLGEEGIDYYQYIEPNDGVDYIMTVIEKDGKRETVRGCRVVEAKLSGKENPVQAYGAALTYCRRYSLLMAFGLATTDDDAEGFTITKKSKKVDDKTAKIIELCDKDSVPYSFICEAYMVSNISDLSEAKKSAVLASWAKVRDSYRSKGNVQG